MSILGLLSMDSHSLSGLSMCQVLYLSIQWPARKNKQSALWLALYRLLWCMLFGGVSELIVVQCLGCGTDLPLVATPSSSLDRFVFGHGCSMGTLAIHCSGLCKHSCLLQSVQALWWRLRAPRCTVPWVWHGLTFGGDSELVLGQVCLRSRLLNGHPCYLLHLGLGSLSNRIWITSLVFVAFQGTVLCARGNDARVSVAASRVVTGTSGKQGPAEPGRGTCTRVFFLPLFRSSSRRASTSNPEHRTSPKRRPAPCKITRARCPKMVEAGPEEDTTFGIGRGPCMPKRFVVQPGAAQPAPVLRELVTTS